jgi:hypothetical protein
VSIVLDGVQLEQSGRDLIADDLEVGSLFRRQAGGLPLLQASAKVHVELALAAHSLAAIIIERFVELNAFVLVIAGLGRAYRRQRQCSINEIPSQRIK